MSFAVTDVSIFTGDEFIELGYVVVKDGHIKVVGQGRPQDLPGDIEVLSRPGDILLPGLIDSHTHALNGNILAIEQPIRFGVTTVCNMHNEHHHISKLKELAGDPATRGRYSDFKCAGTRAIVEGGWPEPVVRSHGETPDVMRTIQSWPKLKDPSEAAGFVEKQMLNSGAEYIKLFHELGDSLKLNKTSPTPSIELQTALVQAAHEKGLIDVGHAFSYEGAMDLLRSGVGGLTHIFLDEPKSDDFIALCKATHAHVNPTPSTCASQTTESDQIQEDFAADPIAKLVVFDPRPREPLAMATHHANARNAFAATSALYRAGVPIIVGSDSSGQIRGTPYGLGVHMELHLLVHMCGLSAGDVLKGATSLIADRFGFNDRGRLAVGKVADMFLIEGDVRTSLQDTKPHCLPVKAVWRRGVSAEFWDKVGRC